METTPNADAGGNVPQAGPAGSDAPLTDADFDRLDALLEGLGSDDAMIVEELDGFLAALGCGAERVPADEYLPEILGVPEGADGAGNAPADLLALIERHARQVEAALAAQRFAPVLAHDESGQPDGVAWAVGFLRGVEMRPDGWEAMLEEGEFADALDAIEALASTLDDDAPAAASRISQRERGQLIDQMTADVADIHEFFRPFRKAGTLPQAMRIETVRREQPKVGRNDPCPCGSGKKYKLCCGR
jgi:uncharacterized protein